MKQLVTDLYYWALDYLYVTTEQLKSVMSRDNPEQYRVVNGTPVLLIPGVYENWRFMRPVARLLSTKGYDVHIVDGLGYNRGTIEQMGELVASYITEHNLTQVVIVAHSKGGLIGKYVLSKMKASGITLGLIALNTPFSGSRYAYVLPLRTLRVFIPNSKALLLLAKDKVVNSQIVSIYGIFDPHIPGGSKLTGAKNVQLQTYGHFRIMNSPDVHAAILENISLLMKK